MGQITFQIPQAGLANSIEDPLVASALQALLTLVDGNLDPSNTAGFVDWTAITSFGAGMQAAPGTYPLAVRVVDGMVQFCGALQATALGPNGGSTLCTLPAQFHPAQPVQPQSGTPANFAGGFGIWQLNTAGVLALPNTNFPDNPTVVSLEGCQFRLA